MANIALRNPQFRSIVIPASGVLSTVCTVTIDGTLRYTLVKNVQPSTTINFDIAELARDYLEITYRADYIPQTVSIATVLTNRAGLNGTGDDVGLDISSSDVGFEAYGTFEEEVNPEVPFGRSLPTLLIPINEDTDRFTIFAPNNQTGIIPYLTSTTRGADAYTGTDTSVMIPSVLGVNCTIKRIDCTKYGEGNRIIYINKYGAQQDLWFFLKETRNLARTNEGYKSNTITYPSGGATYNVQDAPNKVFNTQAKQTHTFSSGYYPEFANQQFEELLLSEYIWWSTVKNGKSFFTPLKVKTSSMAFKTSVNDRLIEYTIEFEEAFDYINNIR
tara:strand:+ start:143 stop:1135 length:993 start_codon:yes stop_codon:yes gene_type:complete